MADVHQPKPAAGWPKPPTWAARAALTGQPLAPVLPAVAAAQAARADHRRARRGDPRRDRRAAGLRRHRDPRRSSRSTWCASRPGSDPKSSRDTAELRLFLLDQDGPEPDDTERARKRGVTMGRQGRDAMTALTADLTPKPGRCGK